MMSDQLVEDMLTVTGLYAEGKINMDEASVALSEYMTEEEAHQMLTSLERDNVVQFPMGRMEIAEDDELCSKYVFTLTLEDFDDPA